MNTFELAKEYIEDKHFQIITEDASDEHISFRYQLNTIHFWGDSDFRNYFFMTLPDFDEVTEQNVDCIKELCYLVSKEAKMVKLYVVDNIILASAELYYLTCEDFRFQLQNALNHLIAAKLMYKRLKDKTLF